MMELSEIERYLTEKLLRPALEASGVANPEQYSVVWDWTAKKDD